MHVLVILTLIIQIVRLSDIQIISLHTGGYDFPMDELVAESHLIARGKFVGNSGSFIVEPANGADIHRLLFSNNRCAAR